jgi:hypothetical protein
VAEVVGRPRHGMGRSPLGLRRVGYPVRSRKGPDAVVGAVVLLGMTMTCWIGYEFLVDGTAGTPTIRTVVRKRATATAAALPARLAASRPTHAISHI